VRDQAVLGDEHAIVKEEEGVPRGPAEGRQAGRGHDGGG
jgi:hypothetical protein